MVATVAPLTAAVVAARAEASPVPIAMDRAGNREKVSVREGCSPRAGGSTFSDADLATPSMNSTAWRDPRRGAQLSSPAEPCRSPNW